MIQCNSENARKTFVILALQIVMYSAKIVYTCLRVFLSVFFRTVMYFILSFFSNSVDNNKNTSVAQKMFLELLSTWVMTVQI